jgi:hypothetical protein
VACHVLEVRGRPILVVRLLQLIQLLLRLQAMLLELFDLSLGGICIMWLGNDIPLATTSRVYGDDTVNVSPVDAGTSC